MISIAIDGASRKNGSPDCVSSGAMFAFHHSNEDFTVPRHTYIATSYEVGSTNQRGELQALLAALDYVCQVGTDARIITDSEYVYKAMTWRWYENWHNKGWITSLGEPVKNQDIWLEVLQLMRRCNNEVLFYHIKGHCIPFGTVTANRLIVGDSTGKELYAAVCDKYDKVCEDKRDKLSYAQEVCLKNHGFNLEPEMLRFFVIMNTVVDAIATHVVDKAYSPS